MNRTERNEYAATMYLSRLMALNLKRRDSEHPGMGVDPWEGMTHTIQRGRILIDQHGRVVKHLPR